LKHRLNVLRHVSKAWFYFRMGNSIYLAFVMSFIQFITVEYVFVIQRIPFLAFLHLLEFTVLFLAIYGGLAILAGVVHMRTQAFTDSEISAPQSPFTYKMLPYGKERYLNVPMGLDMLKVTREIARAVGVLTPELEVRFAKYEKMYEILLAGGAIKEDLEQSN